MKKPSEMLFAFFGTSIDSRFALQALQSHGLVPALVVDSKELPPELLNTQWDFFLVCSYGKILRKEVLSLPRFGALNIHPSLLPKFRGPSPYVSAILADERETGVSLMQMEERMDAGPVLAQARVEIAPEDWPPPGLLLSKMLFVEGVNLLVEALPVLMAGTLLPEPQDENRATYTKKFTDADALLPTPTSIGRFNLPMEAQREAFLKVRAFDKSPRAHFITAQGKRVIITDATLVDGALVLRRVIPEGKKEMSYEEYLRGAKSST